MISEVSQQTARWGATKTWTVIIPSAESVTLDVPAEELVRAEVDMPCTWTVFGRIVINGDVADDDRIAASIEVRAGLGSTLVPLDFPAIGRDQHDNINTPQQSIQVPARTIYGSIGLYVKPGATAGPRTITVGVSVLAAPLVSVWQPSISESAIDTRSFPPVWYDEADDRMIVSRRAEVDPLAFPVRRRG